MTMPDLAEVRKAIHAVLPMRSYYGSDLQVHRILNAKDVLARFALSVLDAPGMTAERLAEIQKIEQQTREGPWGTSSSVAGNVLSIESGGDFIVIPNVYVDADGHIACCLEFTGLSGEDGVLDSQANIQFITQSRAIVPELLAEVLRLRGQGQIGDKSGHYPFERP